VLQGRREKDENEAAEAGIQRLQCHDDYSSFLLSGDMEQMTLGMGDGVLARGTGYEARGDIYEKHKINYRI